jgi:3-(3-hydroxy-phenyl)propionate hydroxylase
MTRFNHGRVLFAGDSAHQVSPFGARGANSGIQDIDNLVWKLKLVMDGLAPERLLDTYSDERVFAADENLCNSTRSTDFITPKSNTSKTFRNAVLQLAAKYPFARKLVNSGRLSVPAHYTDSSLNTPDVDTFDSRMEPGAPMDDAPVVVSGEQAWLLDQIGSRFQLLVVADDVSTVDHAQLLRLVDAPIPVEPIVVARRAGAIPGVRVLEDAQGLFARRYDAQPGSVFLVRPDQHIAARWRDLDIAQIRAAVARATCNA